MSKLNLNTMMGLNNEEEKVMDITLNLNENNEGLFEKGLFTVGMFNEKLFPGVKAAKSYENNLRLKEIVETQLTEISNRNFYETVEISERDFAEGYNVKIGRYPTMAMFNVVKDSKEKTELFMKALETSFKKNHKVLEDVEKFVHDIPVVFQRQIVIEKVKDINSKKVELRTEVNVQPIQESEMFRACNTLDDGKIASKYFIANNGDKYTNEIVSLSLDNSIITDNSKEKTFASLNAIFKLITGNAYLKNKNSGLFLLVKQNGLSLASFDKSELIENMDIGDIAYSYKFLAITPAGLKSGSITVAAVEKYELTEEDGLVVTDCDRRDEILNNSTDGAFVLSYRENGKPRKYKNLLNQFKALSRIGLSAVNSKNLGKVCSYIVLNNIAHNARYNENDYNTPAENICLKYNKLIEQEDDKNKIEELKEERDAEMKEAGIINADNTKDGVSFIAAELMVKLLAKFNIKLDVNTVLGLLFQTRGGGTKDSLQVMLKKDVYTLVKQAIKNGASISKLIINEEEVDVDSLSDEELMNVLKDVDAIYDENSMKLLNHNNAFDLLVMKQAHVSQSSLSMVAGLAMLIAAPKETENLFMELGKEAIIKEFEGLGLEFKFDEDGAVTGVEKSFDKLKRVNNLQQNADFMFTSNPLEMLSIAPKLMSSKLNNAAASIRKMINKLKLKADADYVVIQADPAVLFGCRLLDENEMFYDTNAQEVSALRQPMSQPFAIRTFKIVSLKTIVERINNLNIGKEDKDFLLRFYAAVKGYCIIPASPKLLDTFDGADFDIDAIIIYKDPRIVKIMKKINKLTTSINRDIDEANNESIVKSADDIVFEEWHEDIEVNGFGYLERPNKKATQEKVEKQRKRKGNGMRMSSNNTFSRENNLVEYGSHYDDFAGVVQNYWKNPIAAIGLIATEFYYNCLFYSFLTSKNVTKEAKEFFCNRFHGAFNEKGANAYVSPLNKYSTKLGEDTSFELTKNRCYELLYTYAECDGSIESTIAFLHDALKANRYVAESSLDSAKKMYVVMNMFSFSCIFKALGSDKCLKTLISSDKEENAALFDDYAEDFNVSNDNFFNINLIVSGYFDEDDASLPNDFFAFAPVNVNKTKEEAPEMVLAIKDPLFKIKRDLIDFANAALVLSSNELRAFAFSKEADEIRANLRDNSKLVDDTDMIAAIKSTTSRYTNITMAIRNKMEDEDSFDGVSARQYFTESVKPACKNNMLLSFGNSSKEEIGGQVVNRLIDSIDEKDKKKAINPSSTVELFAEEIIAYLKTKELMFASAEPIMNIKDSKGRILKDCSEYIGTTVNMYKGKTELEDGTEITYESRKGSFEGAVITEINNKLYAEVQRKFVKADPSKGLYISLKRTKDSNITRFNKLCNMEEKFEFKTDLLNHAQTIEFMEKINVVDENGKTATLQNVIMVNGSAFAEVYASRELVKTLKTALTNKEDLLLFADEKAGYIHIKGDFITQKLEELAFVNEAEDIINEISFDSYDDIFFNDECTVISSEDEATSSENNNEEKENSTNYEALGVNMDFMM